MTSTEEPNIRDLPLVTLDDLRHGPLTLPIWHPSDPSLAAVMRWSRSYAYRAARTGQAPGVVRVGGRVVCSTPALLRALAVDGDGK